MMESHAGISAMIAVFATDRPATALQRMRQAVGEWRARAKDRAQLGGLDERMMRDIGLSKAELWRETSKPFWQL